MNVNTVRSVYESLEEEGLITSQQGRGTFVAENAAFEPELESIALEALRRGRDLSRDPRDVARVVMACASMLGPEEELPRPGAASKDGAEHGETLEVRQELRRQIERLEIELARYVRDLPELFTATPRAQPRVTGVEELERTRDTLIAKLSEAQKAAAERAKLRGAARLGQMDASARGPLAEAKTWWDEASEPRKRGKKK